MCLVLSVPAADSACGVWAVFLRPSLPAGRDFGPVCTCGAFPPTAARWAPHFTKPRAATPSEVPAHPAFPGRGIMLRPWAAGITPVLTSALHRFASLGLKSRIDARFTPVLTSWLHRFASLGLKSRINVRIALVLTSLLHRFASLGLKSRIDARIAPVLTSLLQRLPSLGLKSGITTRICLRMVLRLY